MLYLDPPFPVIDGVSFIRDSRSDLDWYYNPLAPDFVTHPDPATGLPVPAFDLIRFRGANASGGLLSFDVQCSVDPARLDDLAGQLQRLMQLSDRPRLMPVPLTAGTVKLTLFDLESGQVPDPSKPLHFVRSISHPASPALYGRNEAMFSVQLDPAGVTALEASMKGEIAAMAVVYGLEMYALRPAYAVTLSIDWNRVQERLDEEYGVDALFFSTQIANTVDKLIEDRVITLTADTFVPEGEDERAVLSRRDRAVQEVQDMITQAFFEPSLNPAVEAEDGWDKAEHLADTISRLALTHGAAAFGGFTYKKTHYTRIDTKTLNVSMSERTTVKRQIFPQGHLSGLFRTLTASGVSLDRFVQDIDLDRDPFFERRRITVVPRVDFDREAVTSVSVRLRYGDAAPRTLVLDKTSAPQQLEWSANVMDGKVDADVATDVTVNLASVPGADRPVSISAPTQTVQDEIFEVISRRLYEIVPVTITALDVPWDRFPQVHVALHYADPPNDIAADDTVILDEQHDETTWNLFVAQGGPRDYTATVSYRAADFRDVTLPPVTGDDTTLTVRNPYPSSRRRTLEVVPVVDWTQTKTVFVDLNYTDEEHDVFEEQSLRFTEDDDAPKTFGVDLADPQRRLVTYQVSVIGRDGSLSRSPHSATLDRRLLVRPGMLGHRIVTVSPDTADFDRRRVSQVVVELVYEDEPNGVRFADSVTLAGGGDRGIFEFDYVDESASQLRYRLRTSWTNGLSTEGDWVDADARRDLVVHVGD